MEFVQYAPYAFSDEVAARFDIIGFDPRGVGASEPAFACGEPGERLALLNRIEGAPDTPGEVEAGEAAARLCIETMGPLGGLLHSEYVARDMDEIRRALGARQISYLGFSYGSALGVWYATLFPDSVRAMVVDGADDPVDRADGRMERVMQDVDELSAFERLLERALTACDTPDCPIHNDGDPIGYFMRAAGKLHLVGTAAGGVPSAGFLGVVTTLYDQDLWPFLWDGLAGLVEDDDPGILLDFARIQLGEDLTAPNFTEHVNCLDSLALRPELDRATLLADSALLKTVVRDRLPLIAATNPFSPSACLFYDQFAPDPLGVPLDGGGVAILVIGNHDDPATPFSESEELVTETLSNGRLVETSHPRHIVYPDDDCVNDLVHRALIDREYPDERVVCE